MNELYHHGILGQKWGVRRFQNKDGSLTPAGKKRYNSDETSGKSESSTSKKMKTAVKVAAIAAGVTLAAYGTYKLAEAYKDKKFNAATKIGNEFINKYYLEERGETAFDDGTKETYYYSPNKSFYQIQSNLPDNSSRFHGSNSEYITAKSEADNKAVSNYNSKIISRAKDIRNDKLNNDKYYRTADKIVNIGNKISDKTTKEIKNVGAKTKTVARKVSNKVLDVIDPIYQEKEIPGTRTVTTKKYSDGIKVSETNWKTQKVKVKRK